MTRLGVAVTAAMLFALPGLARAQSTDAPAESSVDTTAVQAATPSQSASVMAPVGLQRQQTTAQQPAAMTATGTTAGQSEAMMAVGAGAIILGAIIGGQAGTIFMVGGGIVGLYGLWKYMQ